MAQELIIVKQLPEIVEQLHTIKGQIEQRVNEALALDCTEETVKEIKAVRAALKKDFDDLETRRKEVKQKILSPYEQFEQIYKECVTNIFSPADKQLASKITEVETGLKEQKKTEILDYFNELCVTKGIDFVRFEDTGAVVTLTASKKSLIEKVKTYLDKVTDDLAMINTQEHAAEILVEYKQSLNVSQAIMSVTNRHKAIEEELKRSAQVRQEPESKQEEPKDVLMHPAEVLTAPVEVPAEAHQYHVSIRLGHTDKTMFKWLKETLIERGFTYEQLK